MVKKQTQMTKKVIEAAHKSDVVALKGYDPDIGVFYVLHKVINGKDVFTIDNDRGPLLYAYQKGLHYEQKALNWAAGQYGDAGDD